MRCNLQWNMIGIVTTRFTCIIICSTTSKTAEVFDYKNVDMTESNFPEWKPVTIVRNKNSPAALFYMFFDQQVKDEILYFINTFAQQKNSTGDISTTKTYVLAKQGRHE